MDCSTPGFPELHYIPEFAQNHVHLVDDAIQPYHLLLPPSPSALSFPASGSFPMSWHIELSGQTIGASASVLPINNQARFPLGLTGLLSLHSRDSQESSTVRKIDNQQRPTV